MLVTKKYKPTILINISGRAGPVRESNGKGIINHEKILN